MPLALRIPSCPVSSGLAASSRMQLSVTNNLRWKKGFLLLLTGHGVVVPKSARVLVLRDFGKHNSIKPRVCPPSLSSEHCFWKRAVDKLLFRFQRKLENKKNKSVSPPPQPPYFQLLLPDDCSRMGYANRHGDLIPGDRVLRARCLNLVVELCCLSNRTRKKDNNCI